MYTLLKESFGGGKFGTTIGIFLLLIFFAILGAGGYYSYKIILNSRNRNLSEEPNKYIESEDL